jgi:DNA repair exonuclease SbcCD nuclease subunit
VIRRRKIRLVHTSDTHLGDDWDPAAAQRALSAVIDGVHALSADALLIAGDVFDNARISDAVLEFFIAEMERAAVPAVILPGNHDLYDSSSLYLRAPFQRASANLHIIRGTTGQTITIDSLTLDVWGRAMDNHTPAFRPLAGMPPADEQRWLVAVAHGHFHFPDDNEERSSPIYGRQVAEAPCDYLALGHWERFENVSQGCVTAFYSGSPMGAAGSNREVAVNVVDFDPLASPAVTVNQARFAMTC